MLKPLSATLLVLFSMSNFGLAEEVAYPIRNHLLDHTKQFEYKLGDDNLIRLRSLRADFLKTFVEGDLQPNEDALNWHLYDKLGLPYKTTFFWGKQSLLSKGEFIKEISVASEILVAVSNQNRVFLYKPTVLERPISWSGEMGAPFEGELYLPENRRAWTFSCSVRYKPATRRTDFMDPNEIVKYYSDLNGSKFDFGFTATIYVLLGDGRRIVYWDTGLPPSFSRGFLTPLAGSCMV